MRTARMLQHERELVPVVLMATGLGARMRGLLGRTSLACGSGMLLCPCSSLHTFGMHFALDVIYFDARWQVVKTVRNIPPWRMSSGGWRAHAALEMEAGWFDFTLLDQKEPVSFS